MIDEDALCLILRDRRGNFKNIPFYENYKNLELEAKAFGTSEA